MTDLLTLSPAELERARHFPDDHRRGRWVAARAFMRAALAQAVGADPASLRLDTAASGKPMLPAGPFFSLAHSGDLALLAISPEAEVGADIEEVEPSLAEPPSAERFFSEAERAELELLDPPERARRFFQLWTAKEAYRKATGEGVTVAGALSAMPAAGYVLRRPPVPAAYEAAVVAMAEAAVFTFADWPERR